MTDLQKVDIEFSEGDVNGNMAKITEVMERLRREGQATGELSYEKKNEYLHLAYRLASCIEALSDKEMVEKMNEVVKQFDKSSLFFAYDFAQDNFWRENEQEFSKNLDRIVIGLAGDNFSGLEDKHHILNALKYLGSANEPLEKRLEVYDTILPVNNLSREKYRGILLKRLGAKSYANQENTKTLFVPFGDVNERLIKSLEFFGFDHLETYAENNFGFDCKNTESGFKRKVEVLKEDAKKPSDKKPSKFIDLLANTIKYTKPLSYLVLGALPTSIQRRIERRFDHSNVENAFNPAVASFYQSCIEHLGIYAAGGIYSALDHHHDGFGLIGVVAYTFVDELFRGIFLDYLHDDNIFQYPKKVAGSMVLKLPFLPLEKILDYNSGKIAKNLVRISLTLEPSKSCRLNNENDSGKLNVPRDYQQMLEKLAQYPVSEELEGNLVWSRENHHTQGRYFAKEIITQMPVEFARQKYPIRETGEIIGELERNLGSKEDHIPKGMHLAREAGALTFYDFLELNPYVKFSGLTCLPGRRFAYTFVSEKQEESFEEIGNILGSEGDFDSKLTRIFEATKSEYLHLTYFRDCKKMEDKTVLR